MINKDYIKLLKQICLLTPTHLMSFLEDFLSHYYRNVIKKEGSYLIAEGDIPIALCAHLDTVAAVPPTHIYYDEEQNVMWSPELLGADDRAGVFSIIMIILHGFKPTIIFTDDEEIGGVGARALVTDYPKPPFGKFKSIIELDRRGSIDSVYYWHDDPQFENYINRFGFKTNYGSFSDISIIAPKWGCAAVNLSVGYYEEHTLEEHLKLDELFTTIRKVQNILSKEEKMPYFKYKPYETTFENFSRRGNFDSCGICMKKFKKKEPKFSAYGLEVCGKCFNEYCV